LKENYSIFGKVEVLFRSLRASQCLKENGSLFPLQQLFFDNAFPDETLHENNCKCVCFTFPHLTLQMHDHSTKFQVMSPVIETPCGGLNAYG
jgi:hypothetical protein